MNMKCCGFTVSRAQDSVLAGHSDFMESPVVACNLMVMTQIQEFIASCQKVFVTWSLVNQQGDVFIETCLSLTYF